MTLKSGATHNLTKEQDKKVSAAWIEVWSTLEPHELRIDEVLADGSTRLLIFDANDIDQMDDFYFMSGGPGNPNPP